MLEEFLRTEYILGKDNLSKLKNSKVAIFGVGGVGGFVAEGLARSAIGNFVLIDKDVVDITNINRQIIALNSTIGKLKVDAMKERILDINPKAKVCTQSLFYLPGVDLDFIDDCDYVVDAIDTVSAKISLVVECKKRNIPIISAMGAGNKLDPTRFEVSDVFNTSVCPLCKVMRKELKRRNINSLKVVYSKEEPITPILPQSMDSKSNKRQTPGSISFVPSVMGLIIACEVIKDITDTHNNNRGDVL